MHYKRLIFVLIVVGLVTTSCKTKYAKTLFYRHEVFACYYASKFEGHKTANGEIFSNKKLTAAHKTLSFGTKVRVTNLVNSKSVDVVINDRGPFTKGLEIDLSKKAFDLITDDPKKGKLKVSLEIIP